MVCAAEAASKQPEGIINQARRSCLWSRCPIDTEKSIKSVLVQKSIVLLRHSLRLVGMPSQSAQQPDRGTEDMGIEDVGTELVGGSSGIPADALKSWYQQYTAQDSD